MNNWSSGYVADIDYTYGYYPELNPLRTKLALLNSGLQFNSIDTACELGFGQGMSVNLHAASSQIRWFGTDFNPVQASFAQELSAIAGAGARLYDDAFDEFIERKDLPDFDFIGLHGIWSWISQENREIITRFIRKKLKVGGILYVSYNTLPGWTTFSPMRHLMTEHAEIIGAEGLGIVQRIDEALEFTEKLLELNPMYAKANPLVTDRLKSIKEQNRQYLAHEYFNRDWHPMHFGTMADCLESAKLSFACSANYLDHIDVINLTTEQQEFLSSINNIMFRETVRDFMVNQQFRRDYWIKGARQMNPVARIEKLREIRVILTVHPSEVTFKTKGARGEVSLNEEIYRPIIEVLADLKIYSIHELEQRLSASNISLAQLLQAVIILTSTGVIHVAQNDGDISRAKKHSAKLNQHLMEEARGRSDIGYLACPVTGGGIQSNRFEQLFCLAFKRGTKQPKEWAEFVWQTLENQGHKIIKEGKTLETKEENCKELEIQAAKFADQRLGIFRALQII